MRTPEQELTLHDFARMLRHRGPLLLAMTLGVLAVAGTLFAVSKKQYEATGTIRVSNPHTNTGNTMLTGVNAAEGRPADALSNRGYSGAK